MRITSSLRRFAAALLGALLLPAVLGGARAGCALAPASERAARVAVEGHAHHGAATAGAEATPDADAREHDAPRPVEPTHCALAMSCVQLAPASVGESLAIASSAVAAGVAAVNDARPESAGAAPEPPPPRA